MIKSLKLINFNKENDLREEAICRVHVSLLRGETFGVKVAERFGL